MRAILRGEAPRVTDAFTQTWPQGEKVVVYQHYGRDITEAQVADLFRARVTGTF